MCQLTLINLNDPVLNALTLYNQYMINTKVNHQDGFGLFANRTTVFKSELNPQNVSNFGIVLSKRIVTGDPVIGHVRAASIINNVRYKVSKENSHPFETDKLVLAHNGTLDCTDFDLKYDPRFTGKIDSEMFTILLSENYTDNMLEAINKTMKLFTGKFAFLIYSKVDQFYYVVRGETAKLHITYMSLDNKEVGFLINTELEDLKIGVKTLTALYEITSGKAVDFSDIIELKKETCFRVENNDLVEIGEVKENKKVYIQPVRATNSSLWPNDKLDQTTISLLERIVDFIAINEFSIQEFDQLIYSVTGVPLMGARPIELTAMINYVLPTLTRMNNQKKRDVWDKLTQLIGDPSLIYTYSGLQFPYMLNSINTLEKTEEHVRKQLEEAVNRDNISGGKMKKILTSACSFPSAMKLRDAISAKLNDERILVTKDPDKITKQDICIVRYGNSSPIVGEEKLMNSPEFISICANKLRTSKILLEKEFYCPTFHSNGKPDKYPVLIRTTLCASGGKGIILCENEEEFNAKWAIGYYWTQFVKTQFELRVHVVNNKVIRIFKKLRDDALEEENLPIRNLHRGYHFSLVGVETYPKVIELVTKLKEVIHGEFYALDLGYDKESKKYFIFEINSAPGLNDNSAELYAQHIVDKIENKVEELE